MGQQNVQTILSGEGQVRDVGSGGGASGSGRSGGSYRCSSRGGRSGRSRFSCGGCGGLFHYHLVSNSRVGVSGQNAGLVTASVVNGHVVTGVVRQSQGAAGQVGQGR